MEDIVNAWKYICGKWMRKKKNYHRATAMA